MGSFYSDYDLLTDLFVYNYFRYYDPSTGRYITSDPIGLNGGLNTYGYVGGNPIMYFDPDAAFRVHAEEVWNGATGQYEWQYWFEFTHSCNFERAADFVKGRFIPKWLRPGRSKAEELIDDGFSGENDVPEDQMCKCRDIDPALKEIFEGMGYRSGGLSAASTTFSEEQASKILRDLNKEFNSIVEDTCNSDCDDLKNAYPWGSLLKNAKDRGRKSIRRIREW